MHLCYPLAFAARTDRVQSQGEFMQTPHATVTVEEKGISKLLEGIGLNWCDAFGMGGDRALGRQGVSLNTPCMPMLDDLSNWELLLEELTGLKAGCVRFLLPPDGFITKRGTMDFDSVHFQRLERLHEWAGANGAVILLDTIHVPRHLQVKGPDGPGGALDNRAAADPAQFAGHFAGPLLDYCLSERNWTQIRYYSPVSTPLYNGIYHHPKGDAFRAYAGLIASLRKELIDRDLIPQRISLLGPGAPSVDAWPIPELHARGLDLDPLLDAYDQHEYLGRFDGTPPASNADTLPLTELIQYHLAPHVDYARSKGKGFLITELGHVYYGAGHGDPNGPATHDAFLLDAEFAVRAINAGVQGLLRWSFLNPGDIDGRWQLLDFADGTYKRCENTFYGYANLIRYIRPHSDVLAAHVESSLAPWPHIHACGLRKMPHGEITVMVINDHECEQFDVTLKLPPALRTKPLNVIRTDRLLKHCKAGEFRRGAVNDTLPPRSLTAYTTLEYDPLLRAGSPAARE